MTRTIPRTSAVRTNVRIVRDNFSGTAVASLRTFGRAAGIAQESVAGIFTGIARGTFQWKEAILQAWRLITVTAIPAILMAIPFGVIVSVQVGNLIHTLGADSLLGATGGLGVIKQGAPWPPASCWAARARRRWPPISAHAPSARRSTR